MPGCAKAGLIIKDGTKKGSTYAAIMLTGEHGVRMQHNFVHDTAGKPVSPNVPRWLRLTRTQQKITGEESADGVTWSRVATVSLPELPATAQVGLFVTSPQYVEVTREEFGLQGNGSAPSRATAAFDHLDRAGPWTADLIGGPANVSDEEKGGFEETPEGFTIAGSGDIAPAVAGAAGLGFDISQTLVGTFAGLIIIVVIATMFVTAEYRRGLIRTTLSASPLRGRVLVAKAAVVGAVAFSVGIVAAAIVVTMGQKVLRDNGVYLHPVSAPTELRVIAGTGVMLAVAAMLAVGLGALLRRGTPAVTTAVVAIVLPHMLAMSVLPATAAQWLLRIAPAAAFSLQQTVVQYPQVTNVYTPVNGYFPLGPLAGFAVLAGWAALALGLATYLLRRRDA